MRIHFDSIITDIYTARKLNPSANVEIFMTRPMFDSLLAEYPVEAEGEYDKRTGIYTVRNRILGYPVHIVDGKNKKYWISIMSKEMQS